MMKKFVLLDEQPDPSIRKVIPIHDVRSVEFQGWNGLKNGILLETPEEAGVQVLLTYDKTLEKQQNLQGRKIAVITPKQ